VKLETQAQEENVNAKVTKNKGESIHPQGQKVNHFRQSEEER